MALNVIQLRLCDSFTRSGPIPADDSHDFTMETEAGLGAKVAATCFAVQCLP